MRTVGEAVLLEIAGIAATLLGFFAIGVFFFVQRGIFPQVDEQARRYLRAATRSMIVLYGMTLSLALALVLFEPRWVALLYIALTLVLLWAVARMSVETARLNKALRVKVVPQIWTWSAAAIVAGLPWMAGGLDPDRGAFAVAILVIGGFAFASSASLVLFAFEVPTLEGSVAGEPFAAPEDGPAQTATSARGRPIETSGEQIRGEDDALAQGERFEGMPH